MAKTASLSQDLLQFLADLGENNDREWFHANKERYESSVKEPFEDFVEVLIARLQKLDPNLKCTAKEAIFRIARDTRFSKDKTPYKTHVAALLTPNGRKGMQEPGLYLQINAEGIDLYFGAYEPEREALQRIREEIIDNEKDFLKRLTDKAFVKMWGSLQGDVNKRIPKEFEGAASRLPMIYNKQFYFHAHLAPSKVIQSKLPETIEAYYQSAMPMMAFFKKPLAG